MLPLFIQINEKLIQILQFCIATFMLRNKVSVLSCNKCCLQKWQNNSEQKIK